MRKVTCHYDECHTWETIAWNSKFCPDCNCKRKAERKGRLLDSVDDYEPVDAPVVQSIRGVPDGARIAVLNDTQHPFQDNVTLEAVEKFLRDFQPHYLFFNGDMLDFYSISDFKKDPSRAFGIQDEVDSLFRWYFKMRTDHPKARVIHGDGNHEHRLQRWLWKHNEIAGLRSLTVPKLLRFDELGFEHLQYRSVIDFLGFRIEHGYLAPGSNSAYPMNVSRAMASKTGSSGLCGHTHRFSVYSWTDSRGTHSYVENGCLCKIGLEYAPFPNWQQAFTYGVVNKGVVHLHPTAIYDTGFHANGEFYPRVKPKGRPRK